MATTPTLLLTGLDELGWHAPSGFVHHMEHLVHDATGAAGAVLGWLVNTALSCVAGLLVGSLAAMVVLGTGKLLSGRKRRTSH